MHPGKMQSATALIALNYEEATRGLYPNQTRFNISLLKSDEVLSRALEKAGVTNMESLALAEHISVSASSVGGMSIDSGSASAYKIATTYTVSYKRNEELPASISTGDMLQLIIEAYKEVFYENYTYVDTALNPNWNELDELEYVEIGTFFEKEIGKVSRFLKSRANENGTFRSSANNETFTSLQKKAQNFSNIDLEKYTAYVRQSGLSKNRDRYVSKLKYQNQLRNIEYQKFMSHYQNHLATIDMYDSALTSVVLIRRWIRRQTSICRARRWRLTIRQAPLRRKTSMPMIQRRKSRTMSTPSGRCSRKTPMRRRTSSRRRC